MRWRWVMAVALVAASADDDVVRRAATQLMEQAARGIDYASLGQSWNHPKSRVEYREATHPSIRCAHSRARQEASRRRLQEELAEPTPTKLCEAFMREIGADVNATCDAAAVAAALDAELLMPLRALNEGQRSMHRTYLGEPVPAEPVATAVRELTAAVVAGHFAQWRCENPVSRRQLEGLSPWQIQAWTTPTTLVHESGLRTTDEGDLGLFWATKIGGPSHGFDVEGQCILPLLCNARSKAILLDDPNQWPAHPAGRAHFRFLFSRSGDATETPLLWLETLNVDFAAQSKIETRLWLQALLAHAIAKADAIKVALSVPPEWLPELGRLPAAGRVAHAPPTHIVLRPSNGVVEASDYLGDRHDWVQLSEDVVHVGPRAVYRPRSVPVGPP